MIYVSEIPSQMITLYLRNTSNIIWFLWKSINKEGITFCKFSNVTFSCFACEFMVLADVVRYHILFGLVYVSVWGYFKIMQSSFSPILDKKKNFMVLKYEVSFMMCCMSLKTRGCSCAHTPKRSSFLSGLYWILKEIVKSKTKHTFRDLID